MNDQPKPEKREIPRPTICVDLDGVLNLYDGWKGEDHFADVRSGADDFLMSLQTKGYKVVVWTSRNPDRTWAWLHENNLAIYVDTVAQKLPAVAYIDDRAIRFEGKFEPVLETIHKRPHWHPGT